MYRKNLKKSLFIALLGLLCRQAGAQNIVSGRITDETKKPVEYLDMTAVVNDSIVSGTITDKSGAFRLNLPDGSYTLRASLLGKVLFEKTLNLTRSLDLGVLPVNTDMQMQEVVITARKRLIKRQADRLILNVKENPILKGKNTLEILRYAPLVAVSPHTGAVSIKGKPSRIWIDGKDSHMSAADLHDFLTSLSNEEVASIEIISNPPSEYEAAGAGGIVNIITAKAQKRGLQSTVHTDLTAARFLSHQSSVNLNAKWNEKLSLRSFISLKQRHEPGKEDRTETLFTPFTRYHYVRKMDAQSNYVHTSNSLYYAPNPSNEFGLGFRYSSFIVDQGDTRDMSITEGTQQTFSSGDYLIKLDYYHYNLGFNYKLKLDSAGQDLRAICDYYQSDNRDWNAYKNAYFDSHHRPTGSNEKRNYSPTHDKILSSQLDYKKPFKPYTFKAGLKYSSVDNRNSSRFENRVAGGFVRDESLTNAFNYKEQIFAAYSSLSIDSLFNRGISAQIGLRAEHTKGKGEVPTRSYGLQKDYTDFFPTFFLSQSLDSKRSVSLSYSRRIERPSYDSFNPTTFYLNEFSSAIGNPELAPSYTHALELSCDAAGFNASLFYDRTRGEPREILKKQGAKKLQYQWRNIDHADVYGLSVSGNKAINKRLDLVARASWYGKYYRSNFADRVDHIHIAKGTFQGRIELNLTGPYGLNSEAAFEYNGPETYGQFQIGENYAFYFTLSKQLDKGLSFYLKLIDPFDNLRYRFKTVQSQIVTTQLRNNYKQAVSFAVVYHFSAGVKAEKVDIEKSNTDLRNRAN